MTDQTSGSEMFKKAGDIYKNLIEDTPLCIKVFDKDGKLLFINKGGRIEHHLNEGQDLSQWDWLSTVKDQYKAEAKEKFERALKGENVEVEFEHTPEGSTHTWCHGYISPIVGSNGNIENILFYSVDITEAKNEEEWNKLRSKVN